MVCLISYVMTTTGNRQYGFSSFESGHGILLGTLADLLYKIPVDEMSVKLDVKQRCFTTTRRKGILFSFENFR
jgi:hypothetical protein